MDDKTIALLKDRKMMKEQSLFIIDTEKILDEALGAGIGIKKLYYSEKAEQTAKRCVSAGIETEKAKQKDIERFSSVETSRGFLALAHAGSRILPGLEAIKKPVLLDRVQDPSNVGAIIRSGMAFGFENFLLFECAGVFTEKTIRASAGTVFRANFREVTGKDLATLNDNYEITVTDTSAKVTLHAFRPTAKTLIVLGNEGSGVSEDIVKIKKNGIRIEYPGKVESLNVAAAAAIVFYEMQKHSG